MTPKITCMVVDDEQHAVDLLAGYIAQTAGMEPAYTTTKPEEAIELVNRGGIDLLFLDVKMPNYTGLDVIRATTGNTKVILCTAYREYALEGFEHDVVDYLLKPVTYERFLKAIEKAQKVIEIERRLEKGHCLVIQGQTRNSRVKIGFEDIDLLEASGNYTAIFVNKKRHLALMRLKDLVAQLPVAEFIRTHNSYIVPIKKISGFNNNEIMLKNVSAPIPIGPTYKQWVQEVLKKYFKEK